MRNLATFFAGKVAEQPVSNDPTAYLPGNIVAQMLPGNLTHMAIVTDRISADRKRPLVAHNIGAGTRLEDTLFSFEITGHFRYRPARADLYSCYCASISGQLLSALTMLPSRSFSHFRFTWAL